MFISKIRAQGTIEYLVILAVVVVISLAVVFLVTSIAPAQQVSVSANKLTNIASGGISIVESAADGTGNGLIALQNNSSESMTISRVSVDGVDNNYEGSQVISGSKKLFSIRDLPSSCSCVGYEGQKRTCTFVIEYSTDLGIIHRISKEISVDCLSVVNPPSDINAIVPGEFLLSSCGTLSNSGVYTLTADIGTGSLCLTVTASDVNIIGGSVL